MDKKSICIKCREVFEGGVRLPWTEKDEKRWKQGLIFCLKCDAIMRVEAIGEFEECKYVLEHCLIEE